MRVAHQDDHITHAVISPKKSMEFGISSSAEFFQILSSALYKNPMLAMVRETICNAWDAHIDSDLLTKPIEITITDSHLIIKDFGKGIHEDQIQPIYGVYGGSTKANDGRQTGGFGLGCKSPFAYSDHFEVTSSHDGRRTIYNMSKSSGKLDGKPSITPIATFPTTESGITVKIPLSNTGDVPELKQMIHQVVLNGDIHATLNGFDLPRLGLDKSDSGMILISKEIKNAYGMYQSGNIKYRHLMVGSIWVRYGNVIYPIEEHPSYEEQYDQISNLLESYYNCVLVIQAEPDSLSITPSREALTMSEITTSTIQELLAKFRSEISHNRELMIRHHEMVNEYVDSDALCDSKTVYEKIATSWTWAVPGVPYRMPAHIYKTREEFSSMEVFLRYSGKHGRLRSRTWLHFATRYLHLIQENNKEVIDLGKLQSWVRHARNNIRSMYEPTLSGQHNRRESRMATQWWQKAVLRPLINKLFAAVPELMLGQISYFNENNVARDHSSARLTPVRHLRILNHTYNLHHLVKPTVVVSHSVTTAPGRATYTWKNANKPTGTLSHNTFFHVQVSRKTGNAEAVVEALKNISGIEVIDLCDRLPSEQEEYEERQKLINQARLDASQGRKPTVNVKKVRPGLTCLTEIMDKQNGRMDTRLLETNLDPVRLKNPKFVTRVLLRKDMLHYTEDFNRTSFYAAAVLYGAETAFTNKESAYNNYLEKGAVDLKEHVYTQLVQDVLTLPTLLEYHSVSEEKVREFLHKKVSWTARDRFLSFYQLLLHPELCHLVPGYKQLSTEDSYRMVLWNNSDYVNPTFRKQKVEVEDKINSIPLKPELATFLDQLIQNKFVGVIDTDRLNALLSEGKDDPATMAQAITIITTILS